MFYVEEIIFYESETQDSDSETGNYISKLSKSVSKLWNLGNKTPTIMKIMSILLNKFNIQQADNFSLIILMHGRQSDQVS